MNTAGMFSSATVEWATPPWLFDQLNQIFEFTLDPCATAENATCNHFYTREQDGLSKPWAGERVFMNPPYGREIGKWVRKAAGANALVVGLLPARTDTRWWQDYVVGRGAFVHFLRGRLKFGEGLAPAPFPSAIVVFTGELFCSTAQKCPRC